MPRLEFFFDCSSPWTYLAFDQIETLATEANAELVWRPFLVGGVFNTANPTVYQQRANPTPDKLRYYAKDLADWARLYGLTIHMPSVFPVNSVGAMRACFVALEHDCLPAFARSVFEAYWGEDQDISQPAVLAALCSRVGLDAAEVAEKIASAPYKQKLRDNTEELMERGGFGTPTVFIDQDDMYFGNDRLALVREALRGTLS